MARGRSALGSLAPASGRQRGTIRKSLNKKKWSTRFSFQRNKKRVTMDGPARALRAEAEEDRQYVVTAMDQESATSRFDAAADALKQLREGGVRPSCDAPGSVSAHTHIDFDKLASMDKLQLRGLATKVPCISRNKRNSDGKWIPKTCQELRNEFSALKNQSLKRPAAFKRPAFA